MANKTRFEELGYERVDKDLWRIVDMSDNRHIGPHYRTKAELLADLDRYARDFGCCGSSLSQKQVRDSEIAIMENKPLQRSIVPLSEATSSDRQIAIKDDPLFNSEFPESWVWELALQFTIEELGKKLSELIYEDLETKDRNFVPGLRKALNELAQIGTVYRRGF